MSHKRRIVRCIMMPCGRAPVGKPLAGLVHRGRVSLRAEVRIQATDLLSVHEWSGCRSIRASTDCQLLAEPVIRNPAWNGGSVPEFAVYLIGNLVRFGVPSQQGPLLSVLGR